MTPGSPGRRSPALRGGAVRRSGSGPALAVGAALPRLAARRLGRVPTRSARPGRGTSWPRACAPGLRWTGPCAPWRRCCPPPPARRSAASPTSLALGADPAAAWAPALDRAATARLARAARRSARSGSAVAEVDHRAADVRAEAADTVTARAERAGVLVTGPLGLCFLPAFLALGIVPVVVGLAGPLLEQR